MNFYIPFTKIRIPYPLATIFLTLLVITIVIVRLIMPFSQAIEDFIPNYYVKCIHIGVAATILLTLIVVSEVLSYNKKNKPQ